MKLFKSEFAHSYQTYSFGYCQYALVEPSDVMSAVYDLGFLPYSGTRDVRNTAYMARSARVRLKDFTLLSENRRIARQFDSLFVRRSVPLSQFNYSDEKFLSFCTEYFLKRHGPLVMPKERLLTVLNAGFVTDIVVYESTEGAPIGYVFEVKDPMMSHFWFSFYDLEYAYKSLGMWLMLDAVRVAQTEGKEFLYIGTVYGEKALYKTNFEALEFWNGNEWDTNIETLKQLGRSDAEHTYDGMDRWKETHEHF